MADTPRNRVIETITSSAKHRPPLLPPDPLLHTPLVFPHHDKKMKIAVNLITGSLLFYGVFFMDFGKNEHCFSPIRRYVFGKINSFLTVQPEDETYIQRRVESIKTQISQVNEERNRST